MYPTCSAAACAPCKSLNDPTPPRESAHVQELLDACSVLTYHAGLLWEGKKKLLQAGVEKRAIEAELKDAAGILDVALDLLAKACAAVQGLASATELAHMEDERASLQDDRDQLEKVLRWLETALPPLDPSAIPEGKNFRTYDDIFAKP